MSHMINSVLHASWWKPVGPWNLVIRMQLGSGNCCQGPEGFAWSFDSAPAPAVPDSVYNTGGPSNMGTPTVSEVSFCQGMLGL